MLQNFSLHRTRSDPGDRLFAFDEPLVDLFLGENLSREFYQTSFLVPNERMPKHGEGLMDVAPTGVYVAVGSERGFIGAALADNATHLLILDRDPKVVQFAFVNAALLKLSNSLEDYRNLRLSAERGEWLRRAEASELEPQVVSLLSNRKIFHWWLRNVRREAGFEAFHSKGVEGGVADFDGANYLREQPLYQKLKTLADTNRIDARVCQLESTYSIREVTKQLEREGLKIAVLDLSNAWWDMYLSSKSMARAFEIFNKHTLKQGVLILTSQLETESEEHLAAKRRRERGSWGYFGFTFDYVTKSPSLFEFFQRLEKFKRLDRSELGLQDMKHPLPREQPITRLWKWIKAKIFSDT